MSDRALVTSVYANALEKILLLRYYVISGEAPCPHSEPEGRKLYGIEIEMERLPLNGPDQDHGHGLGLGAGLLPLPAGNQGQAQNLPERACTGWISEDRNYTLQTIRKMANQTVTPISLCYVVDDLMSSLYYS